MTRHAPLLCTAQQLHRAQHEPALQNTHHATQHNSTKHTACCTRPRRSIRPAHPRQTSCAIGACAKSSPVYCETFLGGPVHCEKFWLRSHVLCRLRKRSHVMLNFLSDLVYMGSGVCTCCKEGTFRHHRGHSGVFCLTQTSRSRRQHAEPRHVIRGNLGKDGVARFGERPPRRTHAA